MKKITFLLITMFVAPCIFAQQDNNLEGQLAPQAQEALAAQAGVEEMAAQAPLEGAASSAMDQAPAQLAAAVQEEAALVQTPAALEEGEGFVAKREELAEEKTAASNQVVFNPKNRRDPTLSPDDFLLLQYREQQRLAAIEAERQRKLAEERRKREEAERQRQLELARIKDPTREVRNKIKVGGIIGQEVFIGERIYTVGKSIYGAKIVEVRPEEVVFSYKGHKFVRKVQLK